MSDPRRQNESRPRNLRIDIEYDGTAYAGWARQPELPSIEAALMSVLGQILQEDVRLSVAGRTDAGVHARGQVVSLRTAGGTPPARLRRSANQMLPPDIVITAVADAPPGFDARRSARSRTYSYAVLNRAWPSAFRNRYVYFYPGKLDADLLNEAAALAAGRHDFTAFTPTVTEHSHFERDVYESRWAQREDLLVYEVTANAFMRSMVRVLVGTMLEIGRGFRPLADMEELLRGAVRPEAGRTAPPHGLCLEKVSYDE